MPFIKTDTKFHPRLTNTNESKFIETIIDSFFEELKFFTKENEENKPEPWRRYAEQPLLGLLMTGLVRNTKNENITLIPEYMAYNEKKSIGRPDLFINVNKTGYIVESKYLTEGCGKYWDVKGFKNQLHEIKKQQKKYQIKEDYKYLKEVYMVCLVFSSVISKKEYRFNEHIAKSNEDHFSEVENSFYTFIYDENWKKNAAESEIWKNSYSGLGVYGSIEKWTNF